MANNFRVFLSYSHEDRSLVEQVAEILTNKGLEPLWDRNIKPGTAFNEAIRNLILHAHIFMPLITENSRQRPWVHQETGYAIALNIPVLPLAIGSVPGEMISHLQAISVDVDLQKLADYLDAINLEQIVLTAPTTSTNIVQVVDWAEERAQMMAHYANQVMELGNFGRVRQRGVLSAFCIPDTEADDPVWQIHDGTRPRSDYFHNLLRAQRQILEKHAKIAGCDLLIDPTVEFPELDTAARKQRLATLLEFIQSMPASQLRVVCSQRAREAQIIAVGNWFIAESRTRRSGEGWRQTIFTWHAPTVLREVHKFDQLFAPLLCQKEIDPQNPNDYAVETIRNLISTLN